MYCLFCFLPIFHRRPDILERKKGSTDTDPNDRLKLKRPPTAKKYRKELDQLYAEALAEEEAGTKHIKAKL